MTSHVNVIRDDAVQIVRLNRAEKKNALTADMYGALTGALQQAASDDTIAVTVFLGQPGIFTAGNDLGDFLQASQNKDWTFHAVDFLHGLVDCPSALMAAVDGAAVGVGTTLTMHCDMVFASPRAAFSTPFVNLGLVPEAASSLIGPRLMGHARAFEMLVMGETFTATRAESAGLVNHVVPSEELEARTLQAAHALARKPREAVRLSRRLLRGDAADIKMRMKEELDLFAERLRSVEAASAFQAFLQRPVVPREREMA